jgi:hypothetical protein
VKAAVSRLEFAPPIGEIQVDIESGTVELAARSGKTIDVTRLTQAIENAGYKVEKVEVLEPREPP